MANNEGIYIEDRIAILEKQMEFILDKNFEDRILNLEDMARDDADKMDRLAEGFDTLYEEVTEKTATKPQVQQTTEEFVRVVRCKDCVWFAYHPTEYDWCKNEDGMFRPSGEDYCSMGEKR